jgi:hypothetical protein
MAIDGAQPPADELALCASATLAAPSARLACEQDIRTSRTDPRGHEAPRPTPGPVGRLARIALKRARQRFMPALDLGHMVAEGFLEAPADRYMLDFGAYAQIVADGKVFGGLPGRSLDSLRTHEQVVPQVLVGPRFDAGAHSLGRRRIRSPNPDHRSRGTQGWA